MGTKLLYICDNLNEMHEIKHDYPLKDLNTFGISASTKYFAEVSKTSDIPELVRSDEFTENACLILGGGSNILFTRDYKGLIVHCSIAGIELIGEDESHVLILAGGGVEWDGFVEYTVRNNWGGLENLSKIPGSVGAAPIQNIGAYGVEAGDVITEVRGFDFRINEFRSFPQQDCNFSYRNSIFKSELRQIFLVTGVVFRLKKMPHDLNTKYGTIEKELEKHPSKTIQTLRDVVCSIRKSKLPDPKETGNAGSFFKNPVVDLKTAHDLALRFPALPAFPDGKGAAKLSAAWLIDQAGCKGITVGNAGTHAKQPLVLVNLGGASGKEVADLAMHIRQVVRAKFGVLLEPEVNII
jgi:UDP-N-acetylmuramate dehydrogenase